jgi:hypothetical protein
VTAGPTLSARALTRPRLMGDDDEAAMLTRAERLREASR